MKIVIINKSDSSGGAAIVSRRLMEALRDSGEDARMLVAEKLTSSPYVELAAKPSTIKRKFLLERLKIFRANGFNRKTLFKIDTAQEGLPLWKHPLVENADAILLNWVNQGMVSLKGVRKLLSLGKPVIWTMHDMWCMTGICHHAGSCDHFKRECGECPLLGKKRKINDLSRKIWGKKNKIFEKTELTKNLAFVAVSTWLKERASMSSLLKEQKLEVIHNAFNPVAMRGADLYRGKTRILFGAARIDDPIKGLDTLREMAGLLKTTYPEVAARLEIAFFGSKKNPSVLDNFPLPVVELGVLQGDEEVSKAYLDSDIVISASYYETLPGTLVEAQAYGCIPVSFLHGGQKDIIDQLATGYLAVFDKDMETRARNLAEGIVWAYMILKDPKKASQIRQRMLDNVEQKFGYTAISLKYLKLITSLQTNNK